MNLLYFFLTSIGLNLIFFLFAYRFQTDKLTDLSFSFTILILVIVSWFFSSQSAVDMLVSSIIVLWGIRLGSYLFIRVHWMKKDQRFDSIRSKFWSFLGFWLIQALTCFLLVLPVLVIHTVVAKPTSFLFIFALSFSLVGLIIESVADFQKFRFKKLNPSEFMQKGLWKFIQHPNYLGEIIFWWGISLASVAFIPFYYGLVSSFWISFILIGFSGIPVLQKQWNTKYNKEIDYQEYAKKTYKLIPYIY